MSLNINGLNAYYGRMQVLSDVNLHVDEGEIVSLIGSNGAGKTTLLRAISQLVRSEGSIRFNGTELSGVPPQRVVGLGVAQSPEGRQLFPDMSVQDNLELGAFLRKNRSEYRSDLERVYELFPVLHERRSQYARTMSGGEQQMLAIGRALMTKPRILLLDEPSFGVAPIIVDRIFAVIRQLNQEGLTALVIEQNVPVALQNAERVYVLEHGHIVMEDSSANLANDSRIREVYLGM